MSISRRHVLRLLSLLSAGFIPAVRAGDHAGESGRNVLGCQLHDDVSVSLLRTYARSLALEDADARWKAQELFHEAQLARRGGGTMGHKLGSIHKTFLEAHEQVARRLP